MADPHKYMQQKLDEYSKKYPNQSFRFISSKEEDLKERIDLDGWNPVKAEGSGIAGEVRCGDLILAGRPREATEEQRKRESDKGRTAIAATERAFENDILAEGAQGKYLRPLTPGEAAGFGRKHSD